MIGYTSYIGSKKRRDPVVALGWRMLVPAHRSSKLKKPDCKYAMDSGAWSAYKQGVEFDEAAFAHGVDRMGEGSDWIVLPDIVGGGQDSLDLSLRWLDKIKGISMLLIAVQDGMKPQDLVGIVGPEVGIFLGGTTEFKLTTMRDWGRFSQSSKCYFHVGRVNSRKRILQCQDAGAHSFDGSGVSRFFHMDRRPADRMLAATKQGHLWGRSEV